MPRNTRGPARVSHSLCSGCSQIRRAWPESFARPRRARPTMPASKRISAYTSAIVRGFIARKFSGCSSNFATVSCLYGTDPITSVGRSFKISPTASIRQQSPSCGNSATGATSTHHFVTPTSDDLAPIAYKIEVALGASDTILSFPCSARLFITMRENTRRVLLFLHKPGCGGNLDAALDLVISCRPRVGRERDFIVTFAARRLARGRPNPMTQGSCNA